MFCCIKGLFPAFSESRSAIPLDPNGFAAKSYDRISISFQLKNMLLLVIKVTN
jgi:hypothetical protein